MNGQLSAGQAARRLGVSPTRAAQLGDAGLVKMERCVLGRLFDAADVERLRAERLERAFAPSGTAA